MNVFSWSQTAANNATADSSINLAENQLPSTVNDSARAMMGALAKFVADQGGTLTTAGTSTAYTLTTNTGHTALSDGLFIAFTANATCGASPTLNINSLGAKKLRKFAGSAEADLAASDMLANGHYIAQYDTAANGAAGAWIVLNPTPLEASAYAKTILDDADAAAARATLGVPLGTTAEVRSVAADKVLTTTNVYGAAALVTLTDAATISWDMDTGINFDVTLAGNRTLATPTNAEVGKSGLLIVRQDATGSRTLAFSADYEFAGGTATTLTTTASAKDVFSYVVESATSIILSPLKDVK